MRGRMSDCSSLAESFARGLMTAERAVAIGKGPLYKGKAINFAENAFFEFAENAYFEFAENA